MTKVLRRKVRIKRRIDVGSMSNKQEREKQNLERYFDKIILGNPHYKKIVEALQEGDTLKEIARWFAAEHWTHVSESSFYKALLDFRNRHPELLYRDDIKNLDMEVGANRPNVDPLVEMNRIYRLQKKRLHIDYNNEKNINKLFDTMNDEVKESRELLIAIAKLEGKIANTGGFGDPQDGSYGPEVRDELRKIKMQEQSREQLRQLTQSFIKSVQNDQLRGKT